MLFLIRRALTSSTVTYPRSFLTTAPRHFASKGPSSDYDETELNAARQWLKKLNPETIPQKLCEVTFSRSSGPGGQNVNKVSSKATLRLPTSSLLPLLPKPLHESILSSRYHARSSGDIVIQADESRKQADNVQACYRRLLDMITEAGRESVPGETSAEQTAKVRRLQKADDEARKRMKIQHSSKKASRRGGGKFE